MNLFEIFVSIKRGMGCYTEAMFTVASNKEMWEEGEVEKKILAIIPEAETVDANFVYCDVEATKEVKIWNVTSVITELNGEENTLEFINDDILYIEPDWFVI